MTADVFLFETNSATGQVVETRLTGADAEAWRADRGLSSEEQLKVFRDERDRRLAETDYLALSDVTLSAEMAEYRQALRDLPENTSDPANPTWPVKPS